MGRTVDQDVHAAFVEFRAKGEAAHRYLHSAIAACRTSLMLTGLQKMTSASLCNASIANKSARRTLLARSSTFSSAPALQTILMPRVLKRVLEMEDQLHQMVSTGHRR